MARLGEVIEGLQILAKYSGIESHHISAGHEEIYAGPALEWDEFEADEEDATRTKYVGTRMSAEDVARLRELGWFIDHDNLHWMRFV